MASYWLPDDLLYSGEAGYLVPCFVIGWDRVFPDPPTVGERIFAIHHQIGGYTCNQVDVLGLVLPLRLNVERARVDPGPQALLKDLCVWAERSYPGPDAWFSPFFKRWYKTFGQAMPAEDLETLDRVLEETYGGLPAVRQCQEGHARFDPPSRERFLGWEALTIATVDEDDDDDDDDEYDSSPLVAESFAALDALERELGRPPALHLLWANSD